MLEQGYLATLCYLSPNSVSSTRRRFSLGVLSAVFFCHLCYDDLTHAYGGYTQDGEGTGWTLLR